MVELWLQAKAEAFKMADDTEGCERPLKKQLQKPPKPIKFVGFFLFWFVILPIASRPEASTGSSAYLGCCRLEVTR